MIVQTGVAMMAIICLPRQFHVTVVENIEPQDMRLARWVFPGYLILAALFVVPIALAGQMLLPNSVLPDSFVISLPLAEAHPALALLAFIGGASAATGMVIVEAVALSTMVSNDMLLPWLLRRNNAERPFEVFRHWMLTVRRVTIVVILLLAYVSYRLLGSTASLATIGQVAFAAVTQLAPAMLGALYWKQANRRRVRRPGHRHLPVVLHPGTADCRPQRGLVAGAVPGPGLAARQPAQPADHPADPGRGAVAGRQLHGVRLGFDPVAHAVSEHWQAGRFIGQETSARPSSRSLLAVQIDDLLHLAARFVGEERARQSFIRFAYRQGKGFNPNQNADGEWIEHTERLLSGVLGTSSTRAVVKAAIEGRDMQLEDVVRIADEASRCCSSTAPCCKGPSRTSARASAWSTSRCAWWPGTVATWNCSTTPTG
ncbi:hypothetical protein NWF32_14135 [Pseudomonas qingdaonensis]|nr:hypothetical protein [Pseudomonas qingdaonensis]